MFGMPGRMMCWRCCAVRTESEIRDIFAQCVEACKKYNEFEAIANEQKLLLDEACGDITRATWYSLAKTSCGLVWCACGMRFTII